MYQSGHSELARFTCQMIHRPWRSRRRARLTWTATRSSTCLSDVPPLAGLIGCMRVQHFARASPRPSIQELLNPACSIMVVQDRVQGRGRITPLARSVRLRTSRAPTADVSDPSTELFFERRKLSKRLEVLEAQLLIVSGRLEILPALAMQPDQSAQRRLLMAEPHSLDEFCADIVLAQSVSDFTEENQRLLEQQVKEVRMLRDELPDSSR